MEIRCHSITLFLQCRLEMTDSFLSYRLHGPSQMAGKVSFETLGIMNSEVSEQLPFMDHLEFVMQI